MAAATLGLVRGEAPPRRRRRTASVTSSASSALAAGVEPGVRLVEQPQLGRPGDQRPPARPGGAGRPRAAPTARLGQPAGDARPGPRPASARSAPAPGRAEREPDVLGRGQLVVEAGRVAEQPHPAADRGRVERAGRRRAPTASPDAHREQAGAGAQQAWSCRRRWRRRPRPPRRGRPRGRPPRGRGTGRRAPPRPGDVRRGPWGSAPCYEATAGAGPSAAGGAALSWWSAGPGRCGA